MLDYQALAASWAALALGLWKATDATESMIRIISSSEAENMGTWGCAVGLGLIGVQPAENVLVSLYRRGSRLQTRLAAIKGLDCIKSPGSTEVLQAALREEARVISDAARLALGRRGIEA